MNVSAPTAPLHPGKILFEQAMKPLSVSRNKLARDIDVPVGRISDIVAGKRGVTPDTALRLAKYFGTSPELWMRLQSEYDLHVSRTTTWQKAEPRVREFEAVGDGASHTLPDDSAAPAAMPVPAKPAAKAKEPARTQPAPAPRPRLVQPEPPPPEPPPPEPPPPDPAPVEPPPVLPVAEAEIRPAHPHPAVQSDEAAEDTLDIPDPEEPFLLDSRYEIKSD